LHGLAYRGIEVDRGIVEMRQDLASHPRIPELPQVAGDRLDQAVESIAWSCF